MSDFLTKTRRPRWLFTLLVFGLITALFLVGTSNISLLNKGVVLAELGDVDDVEFDNDLDLITILCWVREVKPRQNHRNSGIEPGVSIARTVSLHFERGPPIC